MSDDFLPRKRKHIYTEQFNVRIEPQLKDDIRYLDGAGIEVSELVRPVLREAILNAKKKVEGEKAS